MNSTGLNGSRISASSSAKLLSRNRCLIRALALSYTILLAMIPLLAVAVSVTSSLLETQGEPKFTQPIDKIVANIMPPATILLVSTNSSGVAAELKARPFPSRLTRYEFRYRNKFNCRK